MKQGGVMAGEVSLDALFVVMCAPSVVIVLVAVGLILGRRR